MALIQEAIGQTEALLQKLKDAAAQLEVVDAEEPASTQPAAPVPLEAASGPANGADSADTVAAAGPDNSLPFKCPACGATYEAPVLCENGHAPEQTLPTADVLAGAAPADATAAPPPQEAQNAVVETAVVPPPPVPPDVAPVAAAAPVDPSWPEGGASA